MDNKSYLIVSKYPEILCLRANGHSYPEIIKALFNNKIFYQDINNVVTSIAKNKMLLKFNRITLLQPKKSKYTDFCIMEQGFLVTLPKTPFNSEYIINEQYLKEILDPVSRIRAKWLIRCFHVADMKLLKDMVLTDEEKEEITNIPNQIEGYYEKLLTEAKAKHLEFLFKQ